MRIVAFISLLFPFSFLFAQNIKPIMIYDTTLIMDKSWNQGIHRGLLKFEEKTNIPVKEDSAVDVIKFKERVIDYVQKGYSPIMLNNVDDAKTNVLKKIMLDHPKTKFIIFNGTFRIPNAQYFVFSSQQSSFLAGYLASKKSKTGTLGFVGGMEIPIIKNFLCGFIKGAKHANPKTEIVYDFLGQDFSAWTSPKKAYTMASKQIENGADVVFAPAGGSSLGVHKAANEKQVYSIGVDSNQNYLYPGTVLTSTIVNVENAAFRGLIAIQKNIWGERKVMGLQENGVGLAFDEHNQSLISDSLRQELNELKAKIVLKEIDLPDYMFTQACKVGSKVIF